MRLHLLLSTLTALLLCFPAHSRQLDERETSLADIRQYQSQLQSELERGRLKTVPRTTKDALARRSEELRALLDSPTAATNETELARIGEQFVKFQDAADKAALQVVYCRRTANVGSRLANRVCVTAEDREAERELARREIQNNNWNNLPPVDTR